jgi:hypothetical protein
MEKLAMYFILIVRGFSEVVNTVLSVAKKDFSLVTEELLGFIKERTLDKKVSLKLKCCCMQI